MPRLQLTMVITTAIVLFVAGGYAMWHTWQEQELEYEEIDEKIESMLPKEQGEAAEPGIERGPRIVIELSDGRGSLSARVGDERFELPAQLPELKALVTKRVEDHAGDAREFKGEIRVTGAVPPRNSLQVLDLLLKLGLVDIVLVGPDEAAETSKERARKAAGK